MSTEEAIATLKTALAGGSREEKLQAVLALPDDAVDATAALEAALAEAGVRLEVAILDALYRINQDPQVEERLEKILDSPEAEGDAGEELYMMARIAWNRVKGDDTDPVEAEGAELLVMGAPAVVGPDKLALIVHGTWASKGTWWRKGEEGNFHDYLMKTCGLDYMYADDDPFIWSGRNRNSARHEAATDFGNWVLAHNPDYLEVYAHSHGANVVMLSTHLGLPVHKLVMLSPPVRKRYYADWEKVGKAYNIQAAFDPVVGVARGGQWFGLPQVKEKKLNASGHAASHDPKTWEENGVPAFVGLQSARLP